jgi:HJR/Mrr/RecB family endonuclease
VAIKKGENYLIQAKQTKSLVGNEAIQEICTAKKYYESTFKEQFNLLTITNNDYSSSAKILAQSNEIKIIGRTDLNSLLLDNKITTQDINKLETQRMLKI